VSVVSRAPVARLAAALIALSLPAVVGAGVVARVSALDALASAPRPYFVPGHFLLLYIVAPIVVVSACVLVLAPGLLLALALGRGERFGEWIVAGLALSLLVVSVVAGVVQAAIGSTLGGVAFGGVVLCCTVAAALVAMARRERLAGWPLADPTARGTAWSMVLVPALLAMVLAPKLYWESLNGDGAHAFESARQLLARPLPFWPPAAGDIAAFPGMTSMLFAFPASWFMRLFGPVDAAARLPLLLYLPALVGGIVSVAEARRGESLGTGRRWLVWLAVVAYTMAMAYSATYNPYAADLALPATQDTLLMVCFLGVVLEYLRGSRLWLGWYVLLTYVSLPNGLILMGFLLVAGVLVMRPIPWAATRRLAGALVASVVVAALVPRLMMAAGMAPPGGEYGLVGILRYFAFLQFTDWHRLLYIAIPAGLLPIVSAAWWKRQDAVASVLALVTLAYFLFFFVQANISLHHFVPAMVLPIVIHWRVVPDGAVGRPWVLATAACALLALALTIPRDAGPHVDGRRVGRAVFERVGGYDRSAPAELASTTLLNALFPYDWDPAVPAHAYGGSPLTWNRYAQHASPGSPVPPDANYVLQSLAEPAPEGMRRIIADDQAALYVRSDAVWNGHQAIRPFSPAGSAALAVPRGILFRSVPLDGGPVIIDVVATLERMGIDMAPILARLGVKR
jgi:hypothetical protein